MKPLINILILGTKNLEISVNFYKKGFGFAKMDFDGDINFFEINGSWLSLYPWEFLAQEAFIDISSSGFRGFSLAHNVQDKNQGIGILEKAKNVGAIVVKPDQKK